MSRRSLFFVVGAVVVAGAAVAAATAITLREERDPGCPERAYGCVVFKPGEPIQIGLLLTTSGPRAEAGMEALRGARMALEEAGHRIEGRPIRFLIENDGCAPADSLQGARELASDPLDEPPVVAVIGAACPGTTSGVAQVLSDSAISLLSWSGDPVAFRDPPRSFLVRIPEPDDPDAVRGFRRAFGDRFGHPPSGEDAFQAYRATEMVIEAATALATTSGGGEVVVPRTALLERLRDLAGEPVGLLATASPAA